MRGAALLLVTVAACSPSSGGGVSIDAGANKDAHVDEVPVVYHGMLGQTTPVNFGGVTFCTYSITLTSLAIDISERSTGEVTAATVQNLNVEATVGSCPYSPSPPAIAKYTLATAKPVSNGYTLDFTGDSGNSPEVALTIVLTTVGTKQTAAATFQRTDQVAELNWKVMTSLVLGHP